MAAGARPPRRIIFCLMGTRGDVQPFIPLALALRDSRGWLPSLAAPAEFRDFIEGYGLHWLDIGASLQRRMYESEEGRALRQAGPLGVRAAAGAFFSVDLFESWFRAISAHCQRLRPDALLLTSFPAMSGAAILPRLLGLPTRVVVCHMIPMRASAEFAVPLSGTGFSLGPPWLNRLQWTLSSALVGRSVHGRTARKVVQRAVGELQARYHRLLPSPSLELGEQFGTADLPTLYVYSPALLPKPAEWPATCHVVGPLLLKQKEPGPGKPPPAEEAARGSEGRQALQQEASEGSSCGSPAQPHLEGPSCSREDSGSFVIPASRPGLDGAPPNSSAGSSAGQAAAKGGGGAREEAQPGLQPGVAVGLPEQLQAFLDDAFRRQLPVVYIGIGSMLGTVFEPAQVSEVLDTFAAAAVELAARWPLRAVIHTALGGGKSGQLSKGVPAGAPFLLLEQPVNHCLLLPQCSLVVHHGGAGTTHAALIAGKPALVVPCVPASDQAFWADLVWRRGLGPTWFPISQLTVNRLVAGLEDGLSKLDHYTRNAEEMAVAMHQEDGVGAAIAVIEAAVAGTVSG